LYNFRHRAVFNVTASTVLAVNLVYSRRKILTKQGYIQMASHFESNDEPSGFKKAEVYETVRFNNPLFWQEHVQTVLSYKP
jgi:hypothetical protein